MRARGIEGQRNGLRQKETATGRLAAQHDDIGAFDLIRQDGGRCHTRNAFALDNGTNKSVCIDRQEDGTKPCDLREALAIAIIGKEERRKSNGMRFGVALNDQVINRRLFSNRRDLRSYSSWIVAATVRGHQLLDHELIMGLLRIGVRACEQSRTGISHHEKQRPARAHALTAPPE